MSEPTDRNMSDSTRLHLMRERAHLLARATRVGLFASPAACIDPGPSAVHTGRSAGRSCSEYAAHALVVEIPLASALPSRNRGRALARACRHGMLALGKADGLTACVAGGPATGNAILAGHAMSRGCHESGHGHAGTRRACSRMAAKKAAAGGLPNSQTSGPVLFPCCRETHSAARETTTPRAPKEKVSPRRWEAHEQSATYLGRGNDAGRPPRRALQGCKRACWASTQAYEHPQIDRCQEAQQRRSLAVRCRLRAGSTVRGHPRFARAFDCGRYTY